MNLTESYLYNTERDKSLFIDLSLSVSVKFSINLLFFYLLQNSLYSSHLVQISLQHHQVLANA
jgi:hypothetical protein